MPRPVTRTAVLVTGLALALGCGPQAPEPIAEQPNFTVVPVATVDSGLLLTIMVELGDDMEALSDALWRNDLASLATAAGAIADHPKVSATERGRIQAALGDRFPDFVKGDQRVHNSALRLAEHATAGETSAILQELAELQSGCVACHDVFRDQLRTLTP